jgi:hypothetical protein
MFAGHIGWFSKCRLFAVWRRFSTCDGQLTNTLLAWSVHDASMLPCASAICRAS